MAVTPYTPSNVAYGPDRYLRDEMSAQVIAAAAAGGGKANAIPITATNVAVTAVATAADSVLLPPAKAGARVYLSNLGANAMQVFGQGTDTINAIATGTGVSQATLLNAVYFCVVDGAWRRVLSA